MAAHRSTLPPNLHPGQLVLPGSRRVTIPPICVWPWITNSRHFHALYRCFLLLRPRHFRLTGLRTGRRPPVPRVSEPPSDAEFCGIRHPLDPHDLHQTNLPCHRVRRRGTSFGGLICAYSGPIYFVLFPVKRIPVICHVSKSDMVRVGVDLCRGSNSRGISLAAIPVLGVGFHRHLLGNSYAFFGQVYDAVDVRDV